MSCFFVPVFVSLSSVYLFVAFRISIFVGLSIYLTLYCFFVYLTLYCLPVSVLACHRVGLFFQYLSVCLGICLALLRTVSVCLYLCISSPVSESLFLSSNVFLS